MKKILLCCLALVLFVSCGKNDKHAGSTETKEDSTKVTQKVNKPTDPSKTKVNVYIENSGSMDGFVNGITEFKDVLGNLLVDLKYYYDEENIQIFFIRNEKVQPSTNQVPKKPYQKSLINEEQLVVRKAFDFEESVTDFAKAIDLSWHRANKDARGKSLRGNNTNLNNIFKTILDSTTSNTISILISDCIYSIGDGSTVNLLNNEKNTTKDAFLTKFKKDNSHHFSTMVIKMLSQFDGKYFPKTGDSDAYTYRGELPYYICVVSSQANMDQFNQNIILKDKTSGFENKYLISNEKVNSLYYSILLKTHNEGRFNKQKEQRNCKEYVHAIEIIDQGGGCSRRSDEGKAIQFAVAVDMSKIDVDEDYLLKPANYTLSSENFKISKILPYKENDLDATDKVTITNAKATPTHVIFVKATGTAYSDFNISLKKQMPTWIEESSILDDTKSAQLSNGKSFGLKYWIEGIAEAYETVYKDNKTYFDVEIKVKR